MLTPQEQEYHARTLLPDVLRFAARHRRHTNGDAESAALMGLAKALRTWNGSSSLHTWVWKCVRFALYHDQRDHSGLPRRLWEAQVDLEDLPPQYSRPLSIHGRFNADGDPLDEALADTRALPGEELQREAALAEVAGVCARLPVRQQAIIRECVLGGCSQEAVAQRIGISQMHVSREKRKALAVLRELLR